MKLIIRSLFAISVVLSLYSCATGNSKKVTTKNREVSEVTNNAAIKVFYFHTNFRCETCNAVEQFTLDNLKLLYPAEFRDGKIEYQVINIEDTTHKDLVEKYEVWGQTLLFTKGDKVVDKTTDAFMHVTTNPDKWKSIVKETVDKLLRKSNS